MEGLPKERPASVTKTPVILSPLIEEFCPPRGTVLDPFAGSGSSLLAAKMLGRSYVGIELDAKYHAIATRRLQEPLTTPATVARHAQALMLQ